MQSSVKELHDTDLTLIHGEASAEAGDEYGRVADGRPLDAQVGLPRALGFLGTTPG